MVIIVLLVSCFVSVKHAWKAYLLCLAISIELLLCIRVFEASSSDMPHPARLGLTVILEAALLTAAFLVGQRFAPDLRPRTTLHQDHLYDERMEGFQPD